MGDMDVTEIQLLQRLAVALGIGLLIGAERGIAEGGAAIAGIRTFGLVALLGAVWALQLSNVRAREPADPHSGKHRPTRINCHLPD